MGNFLLEKLHFRYISVYIGTKISISKLDLYRARFAVCSILNGEILHNIKIDEFHVRAEIGYTEIWDNNIMLMARISD